MYHFRHVMQAITVGESFTLFILFIILDLYFPLEMSEVLKSLDEVVDGWFRLGLELGLSASLLRTIERDFHRIGERKREMVWKWMNSVALDPTWCSLANALHAIKMHAVAEKVSVKHRKWCSVALFPGSTHRLWEPENQARCSLSFSCILYMHVHRLELEPDRLIAWYML